MSVLQMKQLRPRAPKIFNKAHREEWSWFSNSMAHVLKA